MIYPSEDKLNKIESKYKLIAIVATRSKQLRAGMKPLIETESTNPITIAFEEVAAGVITAKIPDVDELNLDYSEYTRNSAVYESVEQERDLNLSSVIKKNMNSMFNNSIDDDAENEEAANMKSSSSSLDDLDLGDTGTRIISEKDEEDNNEILDEEE